MNDWNRGSNLPVFSAAGTGARPPHAWIVDKTLARLLDSTDVTTNGQRLRFATAVSRAKDPFEAGRSLARSVLQELAGGPIDLAFLFFSAHYVPQAEELADSVRTALSPRALLGCSGEGVITGTEEIETGAAVTLWAARLPDARIAPVRLSHSPDAPPSSLYPSADSLGADPGPQVLVLLADPFSTPMPEVLSLISDRFPGTTAIGGLAGGGRDQGENRVLLDRDVFDNGLVGVALSGPLSIRTVISQGCRPIGDPYVVTKASQNVIHELGGKPPLEQLQGVFESLPADEQHMAQRALHLGIVVDEHRDRFERGDFLVRNLIGADRTNGSVAIGELVQEGQTVQFHLRDARSASEDLSLLVAADRVRHSQPPLGALLFSCCGRGRGFFGRNHHDISVLRKEVGNIPIAGFFAQGEIGPIGGSNFLHGYTASIALFSEPLS